MRICIASTSFPLYDGHVQSPFLLSLAKELKKSVAVDVVCPYLQGGHLESTLAGIHVHRFTYFWPRRLQTLTSRGGIPSNLKKSFFAKVQLLTLSGAMLFALWRFVRKHKIDIIHAQWSLPGFLSVLVKKATGVPVIVTERGAALHLAMNNVIMRSVLRYALTNCDAVVSNNKTQAALIKQLGIMKPVHTIINGVAQHLFKSVDKHRCKKKLGFDHDQPMLLFVGWLIERKGLTYLFFALQRLLKNHPRARLVVVGDGALAQPLRREARNLGIAAHVLFVGSKTQEEVAMYMNAADVFVLPSISEGRANVLAEALSCETPIVATDVGDAASLVDEGITGYLCRPQDAQDLSEKIHQVLAPSFQKAYTKNILARKKEKLTSWSACAQQYLAVYKKVLARRTP